MFIYSLLAIPFRPGYALPIFQAIAEVMSMASLMAMAMPEAMPVHAHGHSHGHRGE